MGPDLGGVVGDKDRDITQDADPDILGVFSNRGPLALEEELGKGFEADFELVIPAPFVHRLGFLAWPVLAATRTRVRRCGRS